MKIGVNNQPPLLILITTLLIGVAIIIKQEFINSAQEIDSSYGVVAQQLYQQFKDIFPTLNKFSVIIYISGGVILGKLTTKRELFTQKSLLTIVLYLIFSTSFFNTQTNIVEALTALLIILSINQLVKSFNNSNLNFNYLFTGGVLMGITPLLIPQSIFIFPLLLVAYRLFKRTTKECVVSLAGYLLPFLLYSYLLWALSYPLGTVINNIYSNCTRWDYTHLIEFASNERNGLYLTIFLLSVISISILAMVTYIIKDLDDKYKPSRYIFTLFCFLGIVTIPTLLLSSNSTSLVPIMSITLAILTTSFFIQYRTILTVIIYIIMVLLSLFLL